LTKRKQILLLVALMLLTASASMTGCSPDDSAALRQENEDLQLTIAQLRQENEDLQLTIAPLKQENEDLQLTIEQLIEEKAALSQELAALSKRVLTNGVDLNIWFLEFEARYRLVTAEEIKLLALPYRGSAVLNSTRSGAVIEVLDAALNLSNKEVWLYVRLPVEHTDRNIQGWIEAADTIVYTAADQSLVKTPVSVEEGALCSPSAQMINPRPLEQALTGGIVERKGDLVRIGLHEGATFWVREEDVNKLFYVHIVRDGEVYSIDALEAR